MTKIVILTGIFSLCFLYFHYNHFVNIIFYHIVTLNVEGKHSCRYSVSVTKENINSSAISRDFLTAKINTGILPSSMFYAY